MSKNQNNLKNTMVHTRHILGYLREILTSFHSIKFNLVGLKKKKKIKCAWTGSQKLVMSPPYSVATAILTEKNFICVYCLGTLDWKAPLTNHIFNHNCVYCSARGQATRIF